MKKKLAIKGAARLISYEQALSVSGFKRMMQAKPANGKAEAMLSDIISSKKASVFIVEPGKRAKITLEMNGAPEKEFSTVFYFGENAHAEVFLKTSLTDHYWETRALLLDSGAEVQCCFLQSDADNVEASVRTVARLGEKSSLRLLTSNLGAREKQDQLVIMQEGRGSRCEHYEASLAASNQRFSKESDHLHLASGTYSRSVFKYATAGESRVSVEGNVTIEKNAPGSDTHLLAKSLLLSDKAVSRVVPQLFVHNSEVAAGHGSAMTPIHEEELFYLKSRGIGENESLLLVLQGFLKEILQKSEMDFELLSQVEKEMDLKALVVFPRD